MQLKASGFEVVEAENGAAALERARAVLPDLVLLDVMMPEIDGFEVCRQLRNSFLTRHIPVIMLTAKSEVEDRLQGFAGGANDYVMKPWEARELLARVRNVLEWSRSQRSANPLTGLPGNLSIDEEIRLRLADGSHFVLLTFDIDSFKAFNDHYGYARGDEAIRTLARILVEKTQSQGANGDFVGHIGGDDFIILTQPAGAERLAEEIVAEFDATSRGLYDPEDRELGYIQVLNRRHVSERFPLMSVTVALVSTERYQIGHQAELIDKAQELKKLGKAMPGSVVVGERRTGGNAEDPSRAA